jgi:Domain of unknown function (DUF5666)
MNVRFFSRIVFGIVFGLALGVAASAQDTTTAPPPGPPTQGQGGWQGSGGQRGGGRGGWGGGMGRGIMGTVTEVAADHYTVKTEAGDTYTIHYSANTRIVRQQTRPRAEAAQGEGGGGGQRTPPTPIKPTDIKVGDAIAAQGEVDANAKSVGAVMVMQIDPERARQMREMQANYGKTWLLGTVTAIDGVKVTINGAIDNAPHVIMADENTTFRKRRDPVTLADIQVGDTVRVEGAMKGGAFLATAVNSMGPSPASHPPAPQSGSAPPPPPPQ